MLVGGIVVVDVVWNVLAGMVDVVFARIVVELMEDVDVVYVV